VTYRGALGPVLLGAALLGALSGCSGTLDSLGGPPSASGGSANQNGGSAGVPSSLQPFTAPPPYPNTFTSLLGVSASDVSTKLEAAFQQLFYSTDDNQTIYVPDSPNASYIQDPLHGNDVRTEGIGLGMVITVALGHQPEFDQLWTYAKQNMKQGSGPGRDYFTSYCDDDTITPCLDTYGMQQFALALILANRRWKTTDAAPGYASDALTLLDLLKNGIGSPFDPVTHLVREQPSLVLTDYTRSALEMPGAYALWYQASGDAFWDEAAKAARRHLAKSANVNTGLWPIRSNLVSGSPASSGGIVSGGFIAQGYRTQLNLALDAAWRVAAADPTQTGVADKLLAFFDQASTNHDLTTYGANFAVDGTLTLDDGITPDSNRPTPSQALISVNGALVVAASATDANLQLRHDFVNAVWQQDIPSGKNRYYEGLLYLMSLVILSGQLQVY